MKNRRFKIKIASFVFLLDMFPVSEASNPEEFRVCHRILGDSSRRRKQATVWSFTMPTACMCA